jgi:K+-sensing histidine kinase KdpD
MTPDETPILLPVTPQVAGSDVRPLSDRLVSLAMFIGAAAAPLLVALAVVPFRSNLPSASVALGLAIVVSLIAAFGGRLPAAVAAISAALSFDAFFTAPYGSLSITRVDDLETTVLLLISGLIVGQLSARNREHKDRVVRSTDDLNRIQAIGEMLASGAPAADVVAAVAVELQGLLSLRSCWFDTSPGEKTDPVIERNGRVSWGRIWWGFTTLGLPGRKITLPVEREHRRLGRFVLVAEAGTRVSREQLIAAVTLADQAGTVLGFDARYA